MWGSSREIPRTSVDIRDMSGQLMEDVGVYEEKEEKFIKLRRLGRVGRNIDASSPRQPQQKPVDVRGICVRKTQCGKWENMRKTDQNGPSSREKGRVG